jgi:hypothetical protein
MNFVVEKSPLVNEKKPELRLETGSVSPSFKREMAVASFWSVRALSNERNWGRSESRLAAGITTADTVYAVLFGRN